MARRLAARPAGGRAARPDPERLAQRYLDAHPPEERERAAELLDLARASWRLRDDDNLYLGRLEALLNAALAEMRRRGLAVDARLEPRRIALPSPLGGAEPPDTTDACPPPGAAAVRDGAPTVTGRRPASAARPARSSASPPAPALPSGRRASSRAATTCSPSRTARSSSATRSAPR